MDYRYVCMYLCESIVRDTPHAIASPSFARMREPSCELGIIICSSTPAPHRTASSIALDGPPPPPQAIIVSARMSPRAHNTAPPCAVELRAIRTRCRDAVRLAGPKAERDRAGPITHNNIISEFRFGWVRERETGMVSHRPSSPCDRDAARGAV